MKTCNRCDETKDFGEFYKNKERKDGYRSECKTCSKERIKKLKESPVMQLEKQIRSSIITENKILFSEKKRLCYICKNIFLIADLQDGFCKKCYTKYKSKYRKEHKEQRKNYLEQNKEKIKEYYKDYNEENKEKIKEKRRLYREKNREKINERQRQSRLKLKEGK